MKTSKNAGTGLLQLEVDRNEAGRSIRQKWSRTINSTEMKQDDQFDRNEAGRSFRQKWSRTINSTEMKQDN